VYEPSVAVVVVTRSTHAFPRNCWTTTVRPEGWVPVTVPATGMDVPRGTEMTVEGQVEVTAVEGRGVTVMRTDRFHAFRPRALAEETTYLTVPDEVPARRRSVNFPDLLVRVLATFLPPRLALTTRRW
jgi:hypothetical protein